MDLSTPLARALGGRTAVPLASSLDLHTVGDLLHHYPRRYVERGQLTGFDELVVGEHASVFAQVEKVDDKQLRAKLRKTDVVVRDGEGRTMTMTMFNRYKAAKELRPGRQAFFAGKVERWRNTVQLANPEYQLVDAEDGTPDAMFAGGLVPIYPATAAVSTWTLRRSVATVLPGLDVGADPLPPDLRDEHGLPGLADALRRVHQPSGWPTSPAPGPA